MKIDNRTGLASFAITAVATTILGIVLVWASLFSASQQSGVWTGFMASPSSLLVIALILGIASSSIVLTRVYVDLGQNRRFQAMMAEKNHMSISHQNYPSPKKVPAWNASMSVYRDED